MPNGDTDLVIPPALAAEIQAVADGDGRPAADIIRDALESYLANWHERMSHAQEKPRKTALEAATRLRELRKGIVLPQGVTIKDLMTHGRA